MPDRATKIIDGRQRERRQASGKVMLTYENAEPTFPEAGNESIEARGNAGATLTAL